jgi:hypothetical protein
VHPGCGWLAGAISRPVASLAGQLLGGRSRRKGPAGVPVLPPVHSIRRWIGRPPAAGARGGEVCHSVFVRVVGQGQARFPVVKRGLAWRNPARRIDGSNRCNDHPSIDMLSLCLPIMLLFVHMLTSYVFAD